MEEVSTYRCRPLARFDMGEVLRTSASPSHRAWSRCSLVPWKIRNSKRCWNGQVTAWFTQHVSYGSGTVIKSVKIIIR